MRSETPGIATFHVEVTNISPHGFWLLLEAREVFLPFRQFPWFESASVKALCRVERPSEDHLSWPELDVDLHLDSIEHPERYPLVARLSKASSEQSA